MSQKVILLVIVGLWATLCAADVNSLRTNRRYGNRYYQQRVQRIEAAPTPYPAAGFRPDREFTLPINSNSNNNNNNNYDNNYNYNENFDQANQRPAKTYLTPETRFRQSNPAVRQQVQTEPQIREQPRAQPQPQLQSQLQPQPQIQYSYPRLTYGAPVQQQPAEPKPNQSERLVSMKSARLTSNREDQEDIDDAGNANAETETVDVMAKTPKAAVLPQAAAAPNPATTATVAYFPANAVNVVQPFAYVQPSVAKVYSNPAAYVAAPFTSAIAQPQYALPAQYFQQQYAFPAGAGPAVAPLSAQLRAW